MDSRRGKSSTLVKLDTCFTELGATTYEYSIVDCLHKELFEVEQITMSNYTDKVIKAREQMLKDLQCQMMCSDGSGKKTSVHAIGCPNYVCSFQQMMKKFEDSNKSDTESDR